MECEWCPLGSPFHASLWTPFLSLEMRPTVTIYRIWATQFSSNDKKSQ